MDPTGPFARRFPLVARPRPVCRPLIERVADLRDRAGQAGRTNDLATASAVHNLAALLASDCGMPELARQWCHHHAHLYLSAQPLGADAVRYALEPLINLTRLHIRDGHGELAFELIESLYSAVTSRTNVTIDGIEIPADFIHRGQAHREVRRWLWSVMLATSARALAVAGRWHDAMIRLRAHKGIGRRMLDGRQVAVIAHATVGDTRGALDLLRDTEPGEPWENAVTACLTRHCLGPNTTDLDQLLSRYHQLDATAPGLTVFHTRLGLSFLDTGCPQARQIATDLINHVITAGDGYAAHDVLSHDGCRAHLTEAQARLLADQVESCALDRGTIPKAQLAAITDAMTSAEQTITRLLLGQRVSADSAAMIDSVMTR